MTSFKMTVCIKAWNNFFKISLFCIPIQLMHFDCVNGFLNSIKEIIRQTEAIYRCPLNKLIFIQRWSSRITYCPKVHSKWSMGWKVRGFWKVWPGIWGWNIDSIEMQLSTHKHTYSNKINPKYQRNPFTDSSPIDKNIFSRYNLGSITRFNDAQCCQFCGLCKEKNAI